MAKKAAPIVLRTRITGMQFLKGTELQDHSGNFRTHPQHQREAWQGCHGNRYCRGLTRLPERAARGPHRH